MKDNDNKSLVQRALDCAGSGLPNHYETMAHTVVVQYGSDSAEAVVAQLYRDDMHGYIPDEKAYKEWLSHRRKDIDSSMASSIRKAELLLMQRKDVTVGGYARAAARNLLARRVLIEDLSLRLFHSGVSADLRKVYTDMLCKLHDRDNWLIRATI